MWLWSFIISQIPGRLQYPSLFDSLRERERERESQKLKGVDDPPNLGMITRLHMVAN